MSIAENIETIWRFYRAGPADDDTAREALFAPDVVWHVPGDSPVSGDYRGFREISQTMIRRMLPLTYWRIESQHVMGNGDFVVGIVHVSGKRFDREIETEGAHIFRFDAAGLIAEAWGFVSKQAELDEVYQATG